MRFTLFAACVSGRTVTVDSYVERAMPVLRPAWEYKVSVAE